MFFVLWYLHFLRCLSDRTYPVICAQQSIGQLLLDPFEYSNSKGNHFHGKSAKLMPRLCFFSSRTSTVVPRVALGFTTSSPKAIHLETRTCLPIEDACMPTYIIDSGTPLYPLSWPFSWRQASTCPELTSFVSLVACSATQVLPQWCISALQNIFMWKSTSNNAAPLIYCSKYQVFFLRIEMVSSTWISRRVQRSEQANLLATDETSYHWMRVSIHHSRRKIAPQKKSLWWCRNKTGWVSWMEWIRDKTLNSRHYQSMCSLKQEIITAMERK